MSEHACRRVQPQPIRPRLRDAGGLQAYAGGCGMAMRRPLQVLHTECISCPMNEITTIRMDKSEGRAHREAVASTRAILRSETAEAHARLDHRFEGMFAAASPDIYHRFVRMNHACHAMLEPLLARETDARRGPPATQGAPVSLLPQLRADMEAMELAPVRLDSQFLPQSGTAEAVGALYVLEGSRLGARFLHRAFQDGEVSRRWSGATTFYLDAAARPGNIAGMLEMYSERIGSPHALQRACASACATFSLFAAAADASDATSRPTADGDTA
ncbi:biliverdin-producing heme oxygenase [Aurantimonas sp. VKM B-3413]|uniref:biliverdin-producing heme oxygenase n=1 Tax=Aurantimonas sp. VKM B-3413 TaxID=2779401 RepID=UPI001E30E68A|nr:biliverdin-producing heme oxygenase [Aurantimonas sp. VKM B-3413]MCB8837609.1 biliverdin-producing heme oxygenase [Aurantimonas sp. VKM B-3413]